MKAQVTRPDGTTIEIEGKPADVVKVLVALAEKPEPVYVPWGPQPVSIPSPTWVDYPWTLTTDTLTVTPYTDGSVITSSQTTGKA